MSDKNSDDNKANQKNPNNEAYYSSRNQSKPAHLKGRWLQNKYSHHNGKHWGEAEDSHVYFKRPAQHAVHFSNIWNVKFLQNLFWINEKIVKPVSTLFQLKDFAFSKYIWTKNNLVQIITYHLGNRSILKRPHLIFGILNCK